MVLICIIHIGLVLTVESVYYHIAHRNRHMSKLTSFVLVTIVFLSSLPCNVLK